MIEKRASLLTNKQQNYLIFFAILGVVLFFMGLRFNPERTWISFLVNNFYFLALSLFGILFISMHSLSSAGWTTLFRRVPESFSTFIPIGGILMFLLYGGKKILYHWTHLGHGSHDLILEAKSAYLNAPFFFLRIFLFVLIWTLLSRMIVNNFKKQDVDGKEIHTQKNRRLSGIFVVLFAITFSFASIDWLMSVEPHWYSTLFPWYVAGGVIAHGMSTIVLFILFLKGKGYFSELNKYHLHDFGKYIFAFSVFWGYLWFSQYLLIWYSNIPEESTYFILRSSLSWAPLFILNLILNLICPFFILISAENKKKPKWLLLTAFILTIGHWVDLYLMVAPPLLKEGPCFGLYEAGGFLGLGSLFVLTVHFTLKRTSLIPTKDPYLKESILHHGG